MEIIQKTFNETELKLANAKDDHIIFEGCDFFYKVNIFNKECSISSMYDFYLIVLQAFAEEYKKLGLDWSITRTSTEKNKYIIERREKIEVCDPNRISYEDVIKNNAITKQKVYKKLQFPYLLSEIVQFEGNESVSKIVLARFCEEDVTDFGIYKNRVIQFGNSGMFLALYKEGGKTLHSPNFSIFPIALDYGTFCFAPRYKVSASSYITRVNTPETKWWLYDDQLLKEIQSDILNYEKYNKVSFSKNIEIASSKSL